jgi:hypothetical protein
LHNIRSEGRRYKGVYEKLLKNGGWEVKGWGRVMEGFDWTKVKHTHSGCHWDSPVIIKLNIDNKKHAHDTGTVCVGYYWKGEGEWRWLRWWYLAYGLHILLWNRTKKPLSIALYGAGRGLRGRDDGTM